MRKLVIVTLFLLNISVTSSGLAGEGGTLKVGVLGVQRLMAETGYAKEAMIKLQNKYDAQRKALEVEQLKLQSDITKYNAKSAKLKPIEQKKWQHKIDSKQKELAQKDKALQEKWLMAQNIETQSIIQSFSSIVEKLAKRDNFDLVLFKDTTLSSLGAQDITDEVIKLANKKSES